MPTSQPCWGRKEHSSSFHDRDHFHTSAATPRFTDVHGPAQRSQLFPLPSRLLYWLRLWHIQQQCLKNIFIFKKKAFESRRFNHTCILFVFFPCLIICPNYLVVARFTYKIKPQSVNQPFSSYAELTQRDLREASQNLKRIFPIFHCKQFKCLPEGMKQTGNCRCGALLLSKTF